MVLDIEGLNLGHGVEIWRFLGLRIFLGVKERSLDVVRRVIFVAGSHYFLDFLVLVPGFCSIYVVYPNLFWF